MCISVFVITAIIIIIIIVIIIIIIKTKSIASSQIIYKIYQLHVLFSYMYFLSFIINRIGTIMKRLVNRLRLL